MNTALDDDTLGFDRLRHRRQSTTAPLRAARPRDPDGRDRLYSGFDPDAATGQGMRPLPFAAVLECSGCDQRSSATLPRAIMQCVPGLHLPWVKRRHGSYMRCPACRHYRWMSVRVGF
jgi:hypothetical protein